MSAHSHTVIGRVTAMGLRATTAHADTGVESVPALEWRWAVTEFVEASMDDNSVLDVVFAHSLDGDPQKLVGKSNGSSWPECVGQHSTSTVDAPAVSLGLREQTPRQVKPMCSSRSRRWLLAPYKFMGADWPYSAGLCYPSRA